MGGQRWEQGPHRRRQGQDAAARRRAAPQRPRRRDVRPRTPPPFRPSPNPRSYRTPRHGALVWHCFPSWDGSSVGSGCAAHFGLTCSLRLVLTPRLWSGEGLAAAARWHRAHPPDCELTSTPAAPFPHKHSVMPSLSDTAVAQDYDNTWDRSFGLWPNTKHFRYRYSVINLPDQGFKVSELRQTDRAQATREM